MNKQQSKIATHIPLLVRTFEKSEGDVLEMGTGYFSTMILRWLCEMSGRMLYSFESKEYWYNRIASKPKPYHKVFLTPNFDNAPIERHWGMALVDHGPNTRRKIDIARLSNYADYIVIHDTQPDHKNNIGLPNDYNYDSIWSLFKYRYDFTKYLPWTSVVSNFKDLKDIQ
jgi:hypothetical protein